VIVSSDSTIIIKSDERSSKETIAERVDQLWAAHAAATKKGDKDHILERIASLTGGIGVIYVGGNTDLEQKELYDRVDDAVCAVRSALEEGVLPGAGKALDEEAHNLVSEPGNEAQHIAVKMLKDALQAPMSQILQNAGMCVTNVYNGREASGEGLNLKTGEKGDLIEMGVIDPLKVTRSALENAVSVASTIMSTNAVITMARSYETASE